VGKFHSREDTLPVSSGLGRQTQALILMSGENFLSHQFVKGLSHHLQVKRVADPQSHRQIAIANPTCIRYITSTEPAQDTIRFLLYLLAQAKTLGRFGHGVWIESSVEYTDAEAFAGPLGQKQFRLPAPGP